MVGVLSYFTRHGTAANLLMVLFVVMGLAAVPQMRAQFFPDVVQDEVDVTITWEGAGPEDVDRAVIEPLLPSLMAVEGLQSSSARASQGRAVIELEFEPGWEMERAVAEVQAAVDSVTTLPEEADVPEVVRSVWRDRVTDVVISGPVGVDQLARFADEFVANLFAHGVTRTTLRGVAAPEVVVEVPTLNLMRYGVTMADLAQVIAEAAATAPAGDITGANARVRTGTERRSVEEISKLAIRVLDDGSTLTIGDVAQVIDTGVDRDRAYFVGPNPGISVRVDRSPQGDAIKIQAQVQAVADEMMLSLPPEVKIDLIRTRAEAISARLELLLNNAVTGLILVVALLFLFLNARTAIWVAAGIPVSLITALGCMYVGGLTLNMMSLFGLIITLGIVVDDAIVVGEHADYRYRHLGEHAVNASENAARRMFMPVLSATLTTIIAFMGLTQIGGRFGEMISDIPFTVIAVLLASLAECFLVLPNHMSHALKGTRTGKTPWYDLPSHYVNLGFDVVRDRVFRPFVGLLLTLRYPILAGALVLLASQIKPLITGDLAWRFFVPPEQASISANIAMLPMASRADTLAQLQELQRAVETVGAAFEAQYGTNPITYAMAEIGGNTGRGLPGTENTDTDLLGSMAVEIIDQDARPYTSQVLVTALQDEVRQLPLTETLSFQQWRWGANSGNLEVQLYGADLRDLKAAAETLKSRLAQYGEISSIEDNLAYDKDEFVLDLTSKGQALGFTIDQLAVVLRHRLNGIEAATFPAGIRSGAIRVELPEGERAPDFLDSLMLQTSGGQYVALSDLVTVSRSTGFGTIRREDGLAVITVSAELSEDDADRAAEIEKELREAVLPGFAEDNQINYRFSGQAADENRFLAEAESGFILCLVGIYLVLAWIFASWTRPLVIMAVIPFGLVGALWGHMVHDMALSMFSIVGLIGMTGIVINDSIVLISAIDERAEGRGLVPAILDGTAERLRPVMLTTLTTVLGLIPLLFEQSRDAAFLKPTVVTLVYGLGFGMFLVLILVPTLLAIGQDIGQARASLRRGLRPRSTVLGLILGYGVLALGWFGLTLGGWFAFGAAPVLGWLGALGLAVPHHLGLVFAVFALGIVGLGLLLFPVSALILRRRATA